MNVKFNTPAFVRVEDFGERIKLDEWLENLGYEWAITTEIEETPIIQCYTLKGKAYRKHVTAGPTRGKFVDCGTNIDLFKALSAMNDENDREQWFTDGEDWAIFRSMPPPESYRHWGNIEGFEFWGLPSNLSDMSKYRKATAEEIIEHFKKTSNHD